MAIALLFKRKTFCRLDLKFGGILSFSSVEMRTGEIARNAIASLPKIRHNQSISRELG